MKYTWGTQIYGISESVLLGLGMCWISVLAARAFIASMPDVTAAELRNNVAQLGCYWWPSTGGLAGLARSRSV